MKARGRYRLLGGEFPFSGNVDGNSGQRGLFATGWWGGETSFRNADGLHRGLKQKEKRGHCRCGAQEVLGRVGEALLVFAAGSVTKR